MLILSLIFIYVMTVDIQYSLLFHCRHYYLIRWFFIDTDDSIPVFIQWWFIHSLCLIDLLFHSIRWWWWFYDDLFDDDDIIICYTLRCLVLKWHTTVLFPYVVFDGNYSRPWYWLLFVDIVLFTFVTIVWYSDEAIYSLIGWWYSDCCPY